MAKPDHIGLPPATVLVPGRHSAWLLRPLLDLGPFDVGPLYSQGVEYSWEALVTLGSPRFALQRTLAPGFRDAMLREAGREGWNVLDPRMLPEAHRTDRWQALCDHLDAWVTSDMHRRGRLVLLLHALCLHECVASLVPPLRMDLAKADADAVELGYWGEVSRYMLRMPSSFDQYRDADLSGFESIAHGAGHAQPAAFNAATKVFVHLAKTGASIERLQTAADLMERCLADAVERLDTFSSGLLTSRFHRALAFLPMRQNDRSGVVGEMDFAEEHARALRPATRAQQLLFVENLHPVMESRSKEALWLGDQELAVARAREVIELDRHDPKSWVELGNLLSGMQRWAEAAEVFVMAAMLGPPVGPLARHLAGTCLRRSGQEILASYFFQAALEQDPFGISPRAAIASQPVRMELESLKAWSAQRFEAAP